MACSTSCPVRRCSDVPVLGSPSTRRRLDDRLERDVKHAVEQSVPERHTASAGPLAGRRDACSGSISSTILPSNNRNPEYHSWNFSIQRELPLQSVLELNYTGSRGTHLFMPVTTLSPLAPAILAAGSYRLCRSRCPIRSMVRSPTLGRSFTGQTVQRFRLLRDYPAVRRSRRRYRRTRPRRFELSWHAGQVGKALQQRLHCPDSLHLVEDD